MPYPPYFFVICYECPDLEAGSSDEDEAERMAKKHNKRHPDHSAHVEPSGTRNLLDENS